MAEWGRRGAQGLWLVLQPRLRPAHLALEAHVGMSPARCFGGQDCFQMLCGEAGAVAGGADRSAPPWVLVPVVLLWPEAKRFQELQMCAEQCLLLGPCASRTV